MKHTRSKIMIDDKEFRVQLTRCNPKFWYDKYRCNLSQFQFDRIFYNPLVIMYNGLQYRLETLRKIEPRLYVLEFSRTPMHLPGLQDTHAQGRSIKPRIKQILEKDFPNSNISNIGIITSDMDNSMTCRINGVLFCLSGLPKYSRKSIYRIIN